MIPPRLILVACATLTITLYCWTAALSAFSAQPLGIILHTALLGGSIAMLLLAALSRNLALPAENASYRLTRTVLIIVLALATAGTITFGIVTVDSIASGRPDYSSDAAAFNHFNAQLVLEGVNPYTAGNRFWHAIAEFPSVGATPLDLGRYAAARYQPFGPSLEQIVADVRQELAAPARRGPEYDPDTLHSYPALAFLVYVPNIWAGWSSTAPTNLLFCILFILASVWGAPRALWPFLTISVLANQFLLLGALRGEFEPVAYFLVICAWRLEKQRPIASSLLLGLGAAVKQIVWPLVPLYAIIVWRRQGPRAALARLAMTALAFAAINLPFIIASPVAWARSQALPVTLPLFPSGVGLVELSHTGLVPLLPSGVYTALEIAALAAIYLWFALARTPVRPELAPALALLPFLLAWRSLLAYFLVLPPLALYASLPLLGGNTPGSEDEAPRVTSPGTETGTAPLAGGVRTGTIFTA